MQERLFTYIVDFNRPVTEIGKEGSLFKVLVDTQNQEDVRV